MGGTTFWEISHPDWVAFTAAGDPVPNGENGFTSLCHPWSAGPAAWLAAHALGVQSLLPGSAFGRVLVAPHVSASMLHEGCSRASGASGSPPLLRGAVPVGPGVVDVEVGLGSVSVSLASGVQAGTLVLSEALVLRLMGGRDCGSVGPEELVVQMRVVHAAAASSLQDSPLVWLEGGSAGLPPHYAPPLLEGEGGLLPGRAAVFHLQAGANTTLALLRRAPTSAACAAPTASCSAALRSAGAEPRGPFPPPSYPAATFLGQDSLTRGAWGGVYGADGGVLFGGGPGGDASPRDFLPSYVQSVQIAFHDWGEMSGTWDTGVNTSDARAPENPGGAGGLRTVGYVAGDPTFAVDVVLGAGAPALLTVAAYAVDWDSKGRRMSVALLQGCTLNALSPIQGVRDFEEGVWLPWVVNTTSCSGFRLRVQQTRGDNSVLSALLFGPGEPGKGK